MDLTKTEFERNYMSDNHEHTRNLKILYAIIALLSVIIIVLGIYAYNLYNNRSTTTFVTAPTKSVSSEKASSSIKKYVEGKDYKITYSNTNLIDRSTLDKALKNSTGADISYMMDTSEDGGDMAKVEVYYNKDKNLLVERLFKNGYEGDEATSRVVYDINQGKIPDNGTDVDTTYKQSWLVYTWERLTK